MRGVSTVYLAKADALRLIDIARSGLEAQRNLSECAASETDAEQNRNAV